MKCKLTWRIKTIYNSTYFAEFRFHLARSFRRFIPRISAICCEKGNRAKVSFPSFHEYIGVRDFVVKASLDRSLSELTAFRCDRIRGKRSTQSRSGRKIRQNLTCRVNIDVILAKWHDPRDCMIEIRISRIKRAPEENDIAYTSSATMKAYTNVQVHTGYPKVPLFFIYGLYEII